MTNGYEIVAVRYGTLASRKSALYHDWAVYGEPDSEERLDYFFYVLRRGDDTIMVDTGFSVEAGSQRGRTCLRSPRDALGDLGVNPEDVSRVIVSHLHYDHVGNLDLFPRADVFVPDREFAFWTSDIARHPQFWAHIDPRTISGLARLERERRLNRYAGPGEIAPGVLAITVGGHSPGQQVFVIETAGAPVVLASDAVHLYEELELSRPFRIVVNLIEMYDAYELLRGLASERGAVLVPGHDPRVSQRFDELPGQLPGLAYRLG